MTGIERVMKRAVVTVAALALLALAANAEPAAAAAKVEPDLAPDKDLMAEITALGENESLLLPKPKITGEMNDVGKAKGYDKNGPGGRNYSVKTIWAPDRQRALYCGGCYYDPNNDVWEYDLAANTWVLLYPPDPGEAHPKRREGTQIGKDGVLRTARGGPVGASHTWWGLTYDPEKKMLFWLIAGHRIAKGPGQKGLELWGYSPWEKKWERQTAEGTGVNNCAVALEYIPELKGTLLEDGGAFSLYDATGRQWKRLNVQGSLGVPVEQVACYDPTNKIVVFHLGEWGNPKENRPGFRRTGHLDIGGMKAELVLRADTNDPSMPLGSDESSVFYYDPVSGHCLFHRLNKGDGGEMWAYETAARKWTRLKPKGPPPPRCDYQGTPAYLDPARNVFVVINPDSVWVYRYKRAPLAGGKQGK